MGAGEIGVTGPWRAFQAMLRVPTEEEVLELRFRTIALVWSQEWIGGGDPRDGGQVERLRNTSLCSFVNAPNVHPVLTLAFCPRCSSMAPSGQAG